MLSMMKQCVLADASATQKAVLMALAYCADKDRKCTPSVKVLAAHAGTSRCTVFRALKALESRGLVQRESGKADGDINTYTIFPKGEKNE